MHPFQYIEAGSVDEAVSLILESPSDTRFIAGGTDLLAEIKSGVTGPKRLIGLGAIPGLRDIRDTEDGLSIGAMATISEVADHPVIQTAYRALAEAAAGLATPQIRNLGTLGGNLTQRPRCLYYRHPLTLCLKKGGDHCFAVAGENEYLCVTGGDRCFIVHPSDTAVALLALDALLEIAGPRGLRILPIEEFFAGPGRDITRENILASGELVTRIYLQKPIEPAPYDNGRKSLYLRAREREGGDFPLVSVAAAISLDGSSIRHVSVVLGGVSPVPYRARRVEEYLRGRPVAEVDPNQVSKLTLPDANPMRDNAHKVGLASNLTKRAIMRLLGPG